MCLTVLACDPFSGWLNNLTRESLVDPPFWILHFSVGRRHALVRQLSLLFHIICNCDVRPDTQPIARGSRGAVNHFLAL